MKNELISKQKGIFYAAFASFSWGILPLYWNKLAFLSPGEILAHRIFWAAVFFLLYSIQQKNTGRIRDLFKNHKSAVWKCLISAAVIGGNWLFYIWGVNSGYVLEVSIAYFLSPIASFFLGVLFLKERPTRIQRVSFLLAVLGVVSLFVTCDRLPLLSIGLGSSFALYGLLRKTNPLNAVEGLTIESLLLAPLCLGYLLFRTANGLTTFHFDHLLQSLLVIATGPLTIVPFICFTRAAQSLDLCSLGFFQYVMPIVQIFLALFFYKQPVRNEHAVALLFIIPASTLYLSSLYLSTRRVRNETKTQLPLERFRAPQSQFRSL